MKQKNVISKNYLEQIPMRNPDIAWTVEENGSVTLHIENKGRMNRLAQKFFKKPKVSHVYMEEIGSYLWPYLDGEKDILALGILVKEHFGEQAEPLYERLARYFQILDSYHFIIWK